MTLVRLVQYRKHHLPNRDAVRDSDIGQFATHWKAEPPMAITLLGMLTLVRLVGGIKTTDFGDICADSTLVSQCETIECISSNAGDRQAIDCYGIVTSLFVPV